MITSGFKEEMMIRNKTLAVFILAVWLTSFPSYGAIDGRDILEKCKKASGGSAWDSIRTAHVKMKLATGGLEGKAESWEDVITGRHISRYSLGPVTGEDGFDGETIWTKDSSGQVRQRQGDDEVLGTANEAYRICLAYWYPQRWPAEIEYSGTREEEGKDFHVLRITPHSGRPFDLWVNAGTWLIDRTVEKTALETRTVFFSDYREVNGLKYPFYSRSTNGETQYDILTNIESVEFNVPLEEGLFGMPAPPPPDFAFAEGRTSTTVPFQLLNNHMYVDVKLNGKGPFLLLCDTGGANIVTFTLADELGLEPEGKLQARGAGEESEEVSLVKIDSLSVGDVTILDQLFAVFPLESFYAVEGIPQSGLIGYEIFRRFVVKIDYENSLLTLTRPDAFSYEGDGTVIPFKFNGRIPQVEGSIDGIPGKFDIDTGSRASLTLTGPFVEKHELVKHFSPKVEGVTGWGVGGPVRAKVSRARLLLLDGIEFDNPVTELSLQTGGAFTDPYMAGNVGAGLLKRFNITFNYDRHEIIFEPNANASKPDVFDRSGMWVNLADSAFEIVDVIENGPAAESGLEAGDTIIAVDGQSATKLSLPELRHRFRSDPPGTRIHLTVKNGQVEREVDLILRDLL